MESELMPRPTVAELETELRKAKGSIEALAEERRDLIAQARTLEAERDRFQTEAILRSEDANTARDRLSDHRRFQPDDEEAKAIAACVAALAPLAGRYETWQPEYGATVVSYKAAPIARVLRHLADRYGVPFVVTVGGEPKAPTVQLDPGMAQLLREDARLLLDRLGLVLGDEMGL